MIALRPAEPRDDAAIARLVYTTAAGRFDLFAGDRPRALRLLERMLAKPGNDTSRDCATVAELDGRVAGVVVAFPAVEGDDRRRRFNREALRRRAPWHWPRILRVARMGDQLDPAHRPDELYIDALATDERFRRRGVATALLDAAADRARALGLRKLTLDTAQSNHGARALYEGAGFRITREEPPGPVIPAIVFYEREVGA